MDIEIEEREIWIKIRRSIVQPYQYDDNFKDAIVLFRTRLKRKFFNPIEQIILSNKLEGEGFAILTIQCALIEMFAAFRLGKIFNHAKKGNFPRFEYKESMKIFIDFLHTAEIFRDNFWHSDNNGVTVTDSPYSATEFYKNVRCGLMHEARTKQNWHITATPKSKSVKDEKIFLYAENDKIKIYRTVLHYRLLHYLTHYEIELKRKDNYGADLRRFFVRKLDHLFDITPSTAEDWWIDK